MMDQKVQVVRREEVKARGLRGSLSAAATVASASALTPAARTNKFRAPLPRSQGRLISAYLVT